MREHESVKLSSTLNDALLTVVFTGSIHVVSVMGTLIFESPSLDPRVTVSIRRALLIALNMVDFNAMFLAELLASLLLAAPSASENTLVLVKRNASCM